jgi:chitin disaccharide deacetylase
MARIAEEFEIRWMRRPFDLPALGWLFQRVLTRHGCRTTDHFTGFRLTGRFGAAELVRLIRELPEGLTEFMCHPGYCGPALRRAPTRLKESRERELRALTAPETRRALIDSGVELVNYRLAIL